MVPTWACIEGVMERRRIASVGREVETDRNESRFRFDSDVILGSEWTLVRVDG
jgi:hypothetical protein